MERIDYDFSELKKKSKSLMQVFGALEVAMRQSDLQWEVWDYLKSHPEAAVANLGCGLDNTGRVCDNGRCQIYNIDLPDVIDLRSRLLPAGEREKNLALDLTDFHWMEAIDTDPGKGTVLFAAGVFCIEKKYDTETVRIYYKTAMDNKIMRKVAVSERNYTEKGRARLKAFAGKSQGITNPYDWKFTVEDGGTINQYTATFYTCGICTLMNQLGLSEYIPAVCAFDYDLAAMNHTKFTREFTLAAGGPYCDCHYDHSR